MQLLRTLVVLLLATQAVSADVSPNIVVILLDDVGIDQLAAYDDQNQYSDPLGYPYANTPNIDALAAGGLRFNQFRTMPVCSPTRAALLSGRYPFATGAGVSVRNDHTSPTFIEFNKFPAQRSVLLTNTLAKRGYDLAAIGKWHLGLEPNYGGTMDTHPTDLGFPTWWGTPGNLKGTGVPGSPQSPGGYYDYLWVENMTRTRLMGVYVTDHTVDRAQAWIATAQEPYFLYLSLNACHTPLGGVNWPPPGHGFGATPLPSSHLNTSFRACLEYADLKLGQLLSSLSANTIVILMGDNGTVPGVFRVSNSEVRYPVGHPLYQPGDENRPLSVAPYLSWKAKKSPYEGGIRAPLIISGPGLAKPGSTSAELVDIVDLYPTIARLAGASMPPAPINGLDFSKVITKPNGRGRRTTSFSERFTPNGVANPASRSTQRRSLVRRQNLHLWKLIHFISNDPGQPAVDRYEFYHLSGPSKKTPPDPLEQNDLGTSHPAFQKTKRAYLELVGKG